MPHRPFWQAILLLLSLRAAIGQPLKFEVASVKPATPHTSGTSFEITPAGGLSARISLGFLIAVAYQIKPFQLLGAPAWLDKEEYAIAAKPPAGPLPKRPGQIDAEFIERLRALLAERFQLAVHKESREMPAYVLLIAKKGPKLREVDAKPEDFRLRLGRGWIRNEGEAKVAMLTSLLSNQLDRPVFDETGLAGFYKFDLTWTPDSPVPFREATAARPPAEAGPSLFTALQEQLGLKLEAARRPVQMIVIDKVERPSEN
jgi:bla regulator protein BlaR1